MSSSDPKRPTFVRWLRTTGQLSEDALYQLAIEWRQTKPSGFKVFTTGPVTWDQFVASKYPHKVLTYQAYLRLIGAAPTFNKD